MADSYTETTTEGWFSRIGDSIKGILFGLFLFFAAFPLLWWNEGRSVERYNSLKEGQAAVVSVPSETVNPANEGKLIHTKGLANTEEILKDQIFGVSTTAIKLMRQVSMYQWQEDVKTESKENVGGSKTTTKTYTYRKDWSTSAVNSSGFKEAAGHNNPAMPYKSESFQAQNVSLGAFKLNPSQVSSISGSQPLVVQSGQAPTQLNGQPVTVTGDGFYVGRNPSDPQVGDLKISFQVVKPTDISVVAQQLGNSFAPYQTKAGSPIDLLKNGLLDANAMFAAAQQENTIITWAIRIGGCFAMWLGLSMLFRPLAVIGSVLPFLGNLISMGTGILSFLLMLPCAMLTIAVAWIAYRPVLAGILIGIAVIAVVAMKFMPRRQLVPAQA